MCLGRYTSPTEAQCIHTAHNVLQTQSLAQHLEPSEPGGSHWPGRSPKATVHHATYQGGHLSMVTDRRPFSSIYLARGNQRSFSIRRFSCE